MEVHDYEANYGNGWIKLYRSIKNKSWYNKPEYLAIWIHLLIEANHKGKEFMFHGEPMKLEPGQLVTGRKKIAQDLGISESKVQRVLSHFEKKERQIEQRTDRQKRVISIVNWNQYQQSEQRVNNERTTSEQRVNTNKNEKNVKNVKKEDYIVEHWIQKYLHDNHQDLVKKMGMMTLEECQKIENLNGDKGISRKTVEAIIDSFASNPKYHNRPNIYNSVRAWIKRSIADGRI